MSGKRIGPVYNKLHRLEPMQAARLGAMVRRHGALAAARMVGASPIVVENLASGGGATAVCRDRVAAALSSLAEASA